uniref:Haem peroxidase n=1 Tax=Nilaparvata lugens TaxID=108931 RepID=A0A220QMD1_NILLU|nr:haem peroxidase [Nilaparvata lugens]
MVSERTPLRRAEGGGPPYVFMQNPNKLYRKQIHQFQCFICSLFLVLFTTAVVISVLRSVEEDTIDNPPAPIISDNSSIGPLLSLSWPLADNGVPDWQGEMPEENDMVIALVKGQQSLQAKDELEKNTKALPRDTASYKHQKSIRTSPRAQYLSRAGYVMDVATKHLISKSNNTNGKKKKASIGRTLRLKEVPPLPSFCSHDVGAVCDGAEYRSIDGSCNNLNHPSTWGVAMQPFRRVLAPDYADGVSAPRKSMSGAELPSAREVSVVIHRPEYRDDPKFTVMLAVWGQFLDHDISATALSQGKDGSTISCCDVAEEQRHPECYPVRVGSGDPYFNVTCLEFVRSAPAPACSFGPREQLNQASSFIDGSVVYGNTLELSSSLRSYESGQLRMTLTPDGRELLPVSTDPNDGCNREQENSKGQYCFASGDARANENMHLTTMHLIMARQHNNLASQLAVLNPTWDDEKIYQESRKIVAAQMQHITYNEFLPVLIGPKLLDKLDLLPEESGYNAKYDDKVDASVSNSFAAASFRFAHTLLPGVMKFYHNTTAEEKIELHNMLFNPYKLYSPGYIDGTMLGAINTPLERMDNYFNKEVTEKLFKQPNKTCGLDLVSLNVQRGRDHGLPAYPEWREHCGLSKPSSFDDLRGLVDDESLNRISKLYKSVDDVDLYTGALSEYPLEGGMLGATLTCLIGDQFKRLKVGDRYWYETSQMPQGFTPEQLVEIRKTSLAQLICDNADNVTVIQPRVMETIREGNTRVTCDSLQQPNLVHWASGAKQKSPQKSVAPNEKKQTLAVKVKSGFISSDDGSIMWDGSLPLVIPTEYFSHKKFAPENFGNDPAYEAFANLYKIQWNGQLSKTDDKLTFSGTFSFPYLDFSAPFSPTSLKSVTGKFLFLCDSFWNNSETVDLSGSYSSPIFFSEKSFNITNALQFVKVHPHQEFTLSSASSSSEKVPIILNGTYSLDKSIFSWDGSALIRLPLNNMQKIGNSLKISNMKTEQTKVGFKVTNGNIQLTNAQGLQETIWSGSFPVDLSNPIFHLEKFTLLQAKMNDADPDLFQYGITWTVFKSGPKYQGKFSMPLYNYTKGYKVIWVNGEFDLDVLSTSDMTVENVIVPGTKYVSRVIFREKKMDSLLSGSDSMDSHSKEENLKLFLADSASAIDGAVPAPIILEGSFSPDKKMFHWSGEGTISIRSTSKTLLTKSIGGPSSPISTKSRYGCSVQAGSFKDASGMEMNLTPPINIPLSPIWSHDKTVNSFSYSSGIHWSGSLAGNILKGTFSFPKYGGDSILGPSLQWNNGTFSLQLQPLWDSDLQSLLIPEANYFSKIAFQGKYSDEDRSSAVDTFSKYKMSEELSSTIYAPIILQGQYSPMKDTFMWNGNLIISFQGSMNQNYKFVTYKKSLQLADSKPTKTTSRIKVSTGSVSVGPSNQDMPPVTWEGDFPVKINVDSLIPPNTFIRGAEVTFTGMMSSTNLNGIFSIPIYDDKGISTLYTGNFSFDYTTAWSQTVDTVLKSNKKYVAKVFFSDMKKKAVNAGNNGMETDTNAINQNLGDGSPGLVISLLGYHYSKPFFCPGFICKDQKLFYWSGDAIISVANQQFTLQKSTQGSMQFGGKVTSGQLSIVNSVNEEKVWEGMLPAQIPTELMMMPHANNMFVEWHGNYSESVLQGVFAINNYQNVNSTMNLMGNFKLMVEPLWFASLDNIVVSGQKYVSQIYLQGNEQPAVNNLKLTGDDTGSFVPIILQGDYSADKKVFLWNGNFIISFRAPKPDNEETFKLMAKKDSYVTVKPTKSPKPTKAPKPTKPPKPPSPIKLSVSLTVVSGVVSAGFENATEVWNGAPPVTMTLDNVLEEESYTTSAQVTWTGTVDKTNFEGTFSVPTTFKNETDTTTVEWKGSFSVKYMVKWSGNLESMVKDGRKLTCKVIFKEFGQKSINPMSSTKQQLKAAKPEIDVESLGSPTACNVILVGVFYKKPFYCKILPFFCTDSTIFTWNGEAILSYSYPPPATTTPRPEEVIVTDSPSPNELKLSKGAPPFTPYYFHQRVVIGKVISGYMKGGLQGESKKTLWSGNVPAAIPFPVFWAPVTTLPDTPPDAYSHGVIWSGSAFGSTVDCSFKLPQYISNGAGSSMRWWNGNVRVHIQSLWTTGIGGLIVPGFKYYSRVAFRETKKYSASDSDITVTQNEINSAYDAPLILLGNYSPDRKVFYWSGNFILVFRNLPSPYTYDLPAPAPFTPSDPASIVQKPLKQSMDTSKSLASTKQKPIVAKVLSGTIVAGTSPFSKSTVWSGDLPTEIPLSVFWTPGIDSESLDTDSFSHGVIWSGAVFGNTVQCSFYLPQHTLVGKAAATKWWKGDMSLKIESAWDIGLAQMIAPGLQYSSRVTFGDEKSMTKLLAYAPSQDVIDSSFKAPITLLGKYSANKKTFYWSGNFIIKFHYYPGTFMNELMMPMGPQNMQQLKFVKKADIADASLRKNVAVIVKSGSITSMENAGKLWSGEMPTTIPVVNGSSSMLVNWTGSIQDSVLSGEYSLSEFMKGQQFPTSLSSGQFSLNIDPMWNSTFDAFMTAGQTFTSKIIMREMRTPSLSSVSLSASGAPMGTIILLGHYSPDKSYFTWFGQTIINVY